MQLKITTLTPVHIGSGEKLSSLEYVVHQNTFYKISERDFLLFLNSLEDKNKPREFADWVGKMYAELFRLEGERKRNRNDNRIKREYYNVRDTLNPIGFCNQLDDKNFTYNKFLNFIKKNNIPKSGVEKGRIEGQVNEAIKTIDIATGVNRLYIPGSSLKGALRTAVLYHWMSNHADRREIIDLIDRRIRERPVENRFAKPLEVKAFYCAAPKGKKDDEKYDLMKLVMFADAHLETPDNSTNVEDIKLFVTQREPGRNKGEFVWEPTIQRQAPYAETIKSQKTLTTDLSFNVEFLYAIKDRIDTEKDAIKIGDDWHWKGISTKVKALFGLDIQTLTDDNLKEKRKEVVQHLIDTMRTFCRRQLKSEHDWIDNYLKNFEVSQVRREEARLDKNLKAGYQKVFKESHNYLMHLGFGTGFRGITEMLYFLEDDDRKDLMKRIMKMYAIGYRGDRNGKRDYMPNPGRFPKSRRLTYSQYDISPLGWLQLNSEDLKVIEKTKIPDEDELALPTVQPVFYNKKINLKRGAEIEAQVIKSGGLTKPNIVKLYIAEDNMPEVPLSAYRSALDVGTVVIVAATFKGDGSIQNAAFRKLKK